MILQNKEMEDIMKKWRNEWMKKPNNVWTEGLNDAIFSIGNHFYFFTNVVMDAKC